METATNPKEEGLTEFQWDEAGDESTFFGIKEETPVIEQVQEDLKDKGKKPEEEEEEVEVEGKGKNKDKKPEETQATFFEDEEEEGKEKLKPEKNEKVEGEEGEEDDEEVKFFTTLSTDLKTKGIFQFVEIKEDEKITEDKFFELQEQEIESRLEEAIETFMNELDEDGKAFLKFKKAGGKNADFFKVYAEVEDIPEVDVKTAEGQNAILRYYYKNYEDLDDADIDDKLEWLEETNKKAKYAEKYNAKIEKDKENKKQALLDAQAENQKKAEQIRDAFINSVKETANKMEEFNGFKFTKQDKSELVDFILKPAVKLENGKYLTGLQSSINKLYKEDKQKLLLLAKLLKSDFDFSTFVKEAQTKVTKETKSKLSETRNTLSGKSAPTRKGSLADLF